MSVYMVTRQIIALPTYPWGICLPYAALRQTDPSNPIGFAKDE
jgi:hypothetical protein